MLAVLAEVGAVGVDHRRGVVVEAGLLDLEDRHDDDHARLAGQIPHAPDRRPVRDGFRPAVVLGLLDLAEVGGVEHLLEADDPRALPGGLASVFLVFGDHGFGVAGPGRLDECGAYDVGHELLLRRGVREPLCSLRP